jgi:hypothetical protein
VIVRSPLPHLQADALLVRFNRGHSVSVFPCCQVRSVRFDHPPFDLMFDLPRQAAWISLLISLWICPVSSSQHFPTIFQRPSSNLPHMQAHASNHLPIIFQPSSDAVPMTQGPSFSTLSNDLPIIFQQPSTHASTCFQSPSNYLPIIFRCRSS